MNKIRRMGYRIITCSTGAEHLHALAELPANYREIRAIVGRCKQSASHAVRDVLPGAVWSRNGEYKDIKDSSHLRNTYTYIRTKQERGTIVWSHRDDEDWISDPSLDIVLMGIAKRRTRIPRQPDARV